MPAAGDVARWRHPVLAEMIRVEHWTNAAAQAQRAGRNLAAQLSGTEDVVPYSELPYFWSDQYDWKMKFVGQPGVAVEIVEESVAEGRFVADYTTDGHLVGVLCTNLPWEVAPARQRILESHARIA